MTRFWIFCLSLLFMSQFAFAGVYKAAPELQKDVFLYQKALKANPNSLAAQFDLAMAYAYTGQIRIGWSILKKIPPDYADDVIQKYEPLAAANPKEWRYPFKLAFGYYFKQNKERAIVEFQKVLAIDPKHVWAMGFISLIKGEMGDLDEAVSLAHKALAIEPDAAALHFLLGEGYRRQGKPLKALGQILVVGRLEAEERLFYGYEAVKE